MAETSGSRDPSYNASLPPPYHALAHPDRPVLADLGCLGHYWDSICFDSFVDLKEWHFVYG
ncbi:hypothetical protein ASPTUDRAFT_51224 [Aspergillus tubingensis CBS 134.48]|uniref:Uncharacterized protein n=1 Tax=Aspergillus tubingensis (strain CBS 134.48) TaxID=767770 RepID=A0A1L9NG58_ASPTC|nr:hypothetical protein ASPTUDRAFT_51224 [Aspergillus tubingensis CBS 134.48]